MNMQTEITAPDAATIDTLPYREAIDRVSSMRSLAMRVAATAARLSQDRPDDQKEALKADLRNDGDLLRRTLGVLRAERNFAALPDALSTWLAQIAHDHPTYMSVMSRMADMTDALVESATGDEGAAIKTLDSYVTYAQREFFDAVTSLTDHIWAEIDDGRAKQLERAMQSATRLGEGLGRLERIGKYVRSMSINASVEASRAGEAGKGLAIIAQEFKVLAEEVQSLTLSARQDIESIENS